MRSSDEIREKLKEKSNQELVEIVEKSSFGSQIERLAMAELERRNLELRTRLVQLMQQSAGIVLDDLRNSRNLALQANDHIRADTLESLIEAQENIIKRLPNLI